MKDKVNIFSSFNKRTFDIVLSTIFIVVLTPVFLICAILVKVLSPGPVFFIQERVGKNFAPFRIIKFRTMIVSRDKNDIAVTSKDNPRITKIGAFLRRTKLDELPQLFNIWRGDMSFVGPRPEVSKYISHYQKEYAEILRVRPGLTDFASLEFLDEENRLRAVEDVETFYLQTILPDKIKLQRKYVEGMSFALDLKIMCKTCLRILAPRKS